MKQNDTKTWLIILFALPVLALAESGSLNPYDKNEAERVLISDTSHTSFSGIRESARPEMAGIVQAIQGMLLTEDFFTNVTTAAGITSEHSGGLCIGQAWGDINNDGWLDLYLTDSDGPDRLYMNQQDGTFIESSMVFPDNKSCGAVFGDIDNDGWTDLYVTAYGPNVLYINNQGTLEDASLSAGVDDDGLGTIAAFGDYDKDGLLDIYLGNHDNDRPDILYHNEGSRLFSIANATLDENPLGLAFAVSFVDYDNDGDLDIYIVNDNHRVQNDVPWFLRNLLYRNDGETDSGWAFTEVAIPAGADAWIDGMGLAIGDYDLNGTLDFYMSDTVRQVLLSNNGDGTFTDVSAASRTNYRSVGWGTVFSDFDLDGWQDLYLALSGERNRLFRNLGSGTFADISSGSYADDPERSLGVAYADYDNDGDVDLVVGNAGVGYSLYRNNLGSEKRWLGVNLTGDGPINANAIGSRVILKLNDKRVLMREIKSGSSLGSGNDMRVRFGLDGANPVELKIVWPNGLTETLIDLPVNEELLLRYPSAP